MTLTHTLTLSSTFEVVAVLEVHGLHAHGKVHLRDIPCEKRRMEEERK
jgi:hypothetical protein